jgi:hypothetical protein
VTLNPFIGITGGANQVGLHTVTTTVGDGAAATVNTFYDDPDLALLEPQVNEIRPVSAYLYVSFVGDTLADGGQTAAVYMPSGSMVNTATNAMLTSGAGAATRLWNYPIASIQPGAYVGPANLGCYVRWVGEDERDSFFYSVSGASTYNYPKLVASGVTTQNQPNIRWVVEVNYEFTTQSRLFNQIPSPIKLKFIEHAKSALQGLPYACANDSHSSLWTRFLDWAKGAVHTVEDFWNKDVRPILGPVLTTAGTVADFMGLPEVGVPLQTAGSFLK